MSHKSFLVLKLIQTHRLNLVIWVPLKRQDLVSFVGNESSDILNFASDRFLCTKNLMILLNFELLYNLVQVRHNNFPAFLPNCSNKVMLAWWHILNQRTIFIQVCIDHQIKGKTWNFLQNFLFIAILYFQEALVPLGHVLIWSHIKEAHQSSFFDHYHDGMNGRKCNIDNTMFKDQDCFNRKFLQIPNVNCPIVPSSRQKTIPHRCRCTCQLLVRLTNVSDNLEFAFRISFVYHDPAIKRTYYQQRMLFEENYLDDGLVFVLNVLWRLNLL